MSRRSYIVLCSKVALLVIGVALVIGVGLYSGSSGRTPTAVRSPHAPISINGNDNFTLANGVIGGSGTQSDPYIIENWAIDASTANGIDIENTTAYFIVRNCLVENAVWTGPVAAMADPGPEICYGICLDNVVNGIVENNTCLNNLYGGICLDASSNDNLTNNICENNDTGICLDFSSNGDTLDNNTCENNGLGIAVDSSDNNTLTNNTCDNNQDGIGLITASNNTLSNNTCDNNYEPMWGTGIELYLLSSRNTLTGNICENNTNCGIGLGGSSNNTISNNTCLSNSLYGISLLYSSNNSLTGNICSNNDNYGIYLSYSSNNNTIFLNYLLNNTDNNAYDNCTNYWDENGRGNYWSDWQPGDNINGTILTSSNGVVVDQPRSIAGGTDQDSDPLVISPTIENITVDPSAWVNKTVVVEGYLRICFPPGWWQPPFDYELSSSPYVSGEIDMADNGTCFTASAIGVSWQNFGYYNEKVMVLGIVTTGTWTEETVNGIVPCGPPVYFIEAQQVIVLYATIPTTTTTPTQTTTTTTWPMTTVINGTTYTYTITTPALITTTTTAPPSEVWIWAAIAILIVAVIAVVAWALIRRK